MVSAAASLGLWEKLGKIVSYPKGEYIIRADEIPSCFYLVKTGTVVALEDLPSGSEMIYYVMNKNSMFLEANMVLGETAGVDFRAEEQSTLIMIDKECFLAEAAGKPQLISQVLIFVSKKFIGAMEELRGTRSHSAQWMLCRLLMDMAKTYGIEYDGKMLIKSRLSLQSIAGMLGVNRATAVRAMHELRDMGLIENINGFYCVRSMEAIKRHQDSL